ncbi:MAG TPA: ATP-binding cassette domain-containing protein [Burkholderiales bacterium]|nr:ATP-binding cassette domain-containing protein [Burkholderiales bacterium]
MAEPQSILPLELRRVNFEAGGRAILRDVSLRIEAGVRTVILGPNGAGKSVLMRICHGLLRPTSGELQWARGDSRQCAARQAMVFQRPVMLRRSALSNIEYALGVRGINGELAHARAMEALESVGLAQLAMRSARVMSGGEQQRLALARAWALRPEVLFLDEPTANLDPSASAEVERIIAAIHAAGTKLVMTTHNLGQARRLADEIVYLQEGRVLEVTRADRFFTVPATDEAAAFIRGELPWI